jgi:ethanolamine ammonia-lyase large subunit
VRLMNYKRFQCYYLGRVRDTVMGYDLCYTNSAGLGSIKIVC